MAESSSASKKRSSTKTSNSKSQGNSGNGSSNTSKSGGGTQRRGNTSKKLTAADAARHAVGELAGLIGNPIETVVGIEPNDDGWSIRVQTVELERIPKSADILALYEVDIDRSGDLRGYRRLERMVRGQTLD